MQILWPNAKEKEAEVFFSVVYPNHYIVSFLRSWVVFPRGEHFLFARKKFFLTDKLYWIANNEVMSLDY